MTLQKALDYIETHFVEEVENLKKLARIPSISLEGFPPEQLHVSAQATAEILRHAGLENVEILDLGDGAHPYIYADWLHKPDKPTLLLYAHHDVQPTGRDDKWETSPFEPIEKNGRLYGRGTADDKAGIIVHSASIASFLKTSGELPVNVKILIEGEEETGSQHLGKFVERYKEKLKSDAMILTDCANIDSGIPSITTLVRGLVSLSIEIQTLEHPVHSGLWGGILPDPNIAMAQILSSLCDMQGNILISGIMDDVLPLTQEEQQEYANLKMETLSRQATGLLKGLSFTVPESEFGARLWRLPHFSVNVLQSGSRKLASNIVQDSAWALISIRLVPNMKPDEILNKLKKHIEQVCPKNVKLIMTSDDPGNWWFLKDTNKPIYQIAAKALEKGYGHSTQFVGCGGSIPFVQPLSDALGQIPAILVGVEDPYTNAHAENESLLLSDFKKAMLGQVYMMWDLSVGW